MTPDERITAAARKAAALAPPLNPEQRARLGRIFGSVQVPESSEGEAA